MFGVLVFKCVMFRRFVVSGCDMFRCCVVWFECVGCLKFSLFVLAFFSSSFFSLFDFNLLRNPLLKKETFAKKETFVKKGIL